MEQNYLSSTFTKSPADKRHAILLHYHPPQSSHDFGIYQPLDLFSTSFHPNAITIPTICYIKCIPSTYPFVWNIAKQFDHQPSTTHTSQPSHSPLQMTASQSVWSGLSCAVPAKHFHRTHVWCKHTDPMLVFTPLHDTPLCAFRT